MASQVLGNMSRIKKAQVLNTLAEHEKQVYHEFELISLETKEFIPNQIPDGYSSKFDIHQLVTDGPVGMDPCQTFEQKVYG